MWSTSRTRGTDLWTKEERRHPLWNGGIPCQMGASSVEEGISNHIGGIRIHGQDIYGGKACIAGGSLGISKEQFGEQHWVKRRSLARQ